MPEVAETNASLLVPRFYIEAVPDEVESKKAGRAKYRDEERIEIKSGGNRQTKWVFPAHEVWKIVENPDGSREPQTYAMRFNAQYRQFKASEAQTLSGTPLSELPFLTASKRLELKALSIHTGEALAALDGQPLKALGMGGREMKNQAIAYLANAAGSADVTRFAGENALLRETIAEHQKQIAELTALVKGNGITAPAPASSAPASPFADWEVEDLKNWIGEKSGTKPRGNPNLATLVRMADEINASLAEKAAA